MPTLRLLGARRVTSRSAKRMEPWLGSVRPATMRRSVDLPQPEGPRRKKSSPGLMARERLLTAVMPGNRLVRLVSVMGVDIGCEG